MTRAIPNGCRVEWLASKVIHLTPVRQRAPGAVTNMGIVGSLKTASMNVVIAGIVTKLPGIWR